MALTAEEFDKWAAEQDAANQAAAAKRAQATETPKEAATDEAAEQAKKAEADAAAAAEAKAKEDAEAKAKADAEAAAKPKETTDDGKARDEQGRFIKVGVHAKEMSALREKYDAQIKELNDKLKAAETKSNGEGVLPEDLAKLQAEFAPEIFAAVKAQHDRAAAAEAKTAELQAKVDALVAKEMDREEAEAKVVAEATQKDIETVADLKDWQDAAFAEDAKPEALELWKHAVATDKILRAMPAWANKPQAERFEEVAKRVASDYGLTLKAKPEPKQDTTKDAAKDGQKAETKPLPPKDVVPSSLSHVQTGKPPETKAVKSEGMSQLDVFHATKNMSRAEMERFIFGAPQ